MSIDQFASDLCMFSEHAGRSEINATDVIYCCTKNDSLVWAIEENKS